MGLLGRVDSTCILIGIEKEFLTCLAQRSGLEISAFYL